MEEVRSEEVVPTIPMTDAGEDDIGLPLFLHISYIPHLKETISSLSVDLRAVHGEINGGLSTHS